MSKLLLVDGSALLHRAYHAYPPLRSKSGKIVGAVYGVVSMLVSALESQDPSHVVVAWDLPKPTFRHTLYIGYKAQRKKAEPEMVEQIPSVYTAIEAMGLIQISQEGYEADDIIGTLSAESEMEVVILTGDQDLMQLVTDKVSLLLPPRGKVPAMLYGPEQVVEKYKVSVSQFVDYKALVGDPSDNIPGVRGIGPKGAVKLLSKYQSLDGIYENLEKIGGTLQTKLKEAKESAYLSQELSRIVIDMKIKEKPEVMEYEGLVRDELRSTLEELNFQSLIRRLFPEEPKPVEDERQITMF